MIDTGEGNSKSVRSPMPPPNRDKQRPWIEDFQDKPLKLWYHRLLAPLPSLEKDALPRRSDIEKAIPACLDDAQLSVLLDDAERLYAARREWSERSEARAVSLMGAVGLASGLVIAGAGLLLDATKVADPWWRRGLGLCLFGLLVCLVASGLTASRAIARGKIWGRPQWRQIAKRAQLSTAAAKRDRAVELLALSSQNYWVAAFRSRQVVVAGAWFSAALAWLGLLALTLAVYAALGHGAQ
jgi:hypothetical protein